MLYLKIKNAGGNLMRIFILIVSICICLVLPAFAYDADRIALIIGNGAYKYSALINPVNDARAMQKVLESVGFTVIEKENLNRQEMNDAIVSFGRRLSGASVGLFFYAGHGVQLSGKNYLIPVGASFTDEKEVMQKAIDANLVINQMGGESARRTNIIILDACRVTSLFRSFRGGRQGLAHMDAPVGTLIAYSTGPGREAVDGPGTNSCYTAELIKEIPKPGLRLEDVFNRVRKAVRLKTNGQQVPWESTSLEGAFYFLPSGERPVMAAEAAPTPAYQTAPPKQAAKPVLQKADDEIWVEPTTGMEFVWTPKGCYRMGCGAGGGACEEDEVPVHKVCVDSFWMGRYEVSNEQFLAFINDLDGRGPAGESWFKTKNDDVNSPIIGSIGNFQIEGKYRKHPVIGVSWYGAKAFMTWLSNKTGKTFDLPTEAQWEYACRSCGQPEMYSGGNDILRLGWTSGATALPVASKSSNGIGIFDMSGNVWEWTRDVYKKDAYNTHVLNNPVEMYASDTGSGASRVIRGGSFRYEGAHARCSNRGSHRIAGQTRDLGFRVMMYPFLRTPIRSHTIKMVSQGF